MSDARTAAAALRLALRIASELSSLGELAQAGRLSPENYALSCEALRAKARELQGLLDRLG